MEFEFIDNKGIIQKKYFNTILEAMAYAERNGYALLKGENHGKILRMVGQAD